MNLEEASNVIAAIGQWIFVRQGIIEVEDIKLEVELKDYSLSQLIEANQMVETENKRKQDEMAELAEKGESACEGISIQMTCADRIIAATYCCMHYPDSEDLVAVFGEKGVGIVNVKYE